MERVAPAPSVQLDEEPQAAGSDAEAPALFPLDVACVLSLQRTAGNRKVAHLLHSSTRPTLARDKLPALSPTDLMNFMLTQRGFSGSKPGMPAVDPKGVGPPSGQGYATFAAVQIVDADGKQIKVGVGAYTGGKGKPHAEHIAVDELRAALKGKSVARGRMMVAVDQAPCPACAARLRALAEELQLKGYDVYLPERASLVDPSKMAGPKTSAKGAFQGKRPPVKPSLVASEELVKPGPRPPSGGGAGGTGGAGSAGKATEPPSPQTRALAKSINESLKSELRLLRWAAALKGALAVFQGVMTLVTMKNMLDMAQSKLTSPGFVLSKEIEAADKLSDDATALQRGYPSFSESIQSKGFSLFVSPVDLPTLGQVVLSLFGLKQDLESFRDDVGIRLSSLRKALAEVTAKRKAAEAILEDPGASAAIAAATMGTAELAQIFAAWTDLEQLEGRLTTAVTALTNVRSGVVADLDFVNAWWSYLFPIWQASEAKTPAPATP